MLTVAYHSQQVILIPMFSFEKSRLTRSDFRKLHTRHSQRDRATLEVSWILSNSVHCKESHSKKTCTKWTRSHPETYQKFLSRF